MSNPDYRAYGLAFDKALDALKEDYTVEELYDESPNEREGTGPWGVFSGNRRIGEPYSKKDDAIRALRKLQEQDRPK